MSPGGSVRISFPFLKDEDVAADVFVTGIHIDSVPGNPKRMTVRLEFSGPTEEIYQFAKRYAQSQIAFEEELRKEREAKGKFMKAMLDAKPPTGGGTRDR